MYAVIRIQISSIEVFELQRHIFEFQSVICPHNVIYSIHMRIIVIVIFIFIVYVNIVY